MVNLAVDIGNTRTKIGLFEGERLVQPFTLESWNPEKFIVLATNQKAENIILSSVAGGISSFVKRINEMGIYCLELSEETPLPFNNRYQTPATLGKDRLAAVAGAWELFPEENSLIFDAGTCITSDVLTAAGEFRGGNISPGIAMRLEAMHRFTARLPRVEVAETESWIGYNTESALRNGAQLGAVLEIEGYIGRCREEFGEINVILTGGDANFLAKKLKSKIFVNHHLVLIGLNKILNYNAERLE